MYRLDYDPVHRSTSAQPGYFYDEEQTDAVQQA
jgi:hypothetical protein